MSAVLASPNLAVNQLPLMPDPEPEAIRASLWGRLTRHAEVRVLTDGSGMLIVQILQGKGALPFVAVRHVPADQLPALEHLSGRLGVGVAVVIVFRGLQLVTHQGQQVLSPCHCEAISLAPFCFINEDGSEA